MHICFKEDFFWLANVLNKKNCKKFNANKQKEKSFSYMIPVLPRDQRKSTKYMLLVINPIFTRLYFSSVALIRHVYNTAVTMS